MVNIRELQRRIAVYDDEAAYRELFIQCYQPLQRFANTFVHNDQVAEEIVSDVFIAIWEQRQRLEEILNLKVYLYVSIKNLSLRHLLKQQKKAAISLDELQVDLESHSHDPEQLMITKELLASYEKAVNSLPPRCKLIYKLIREDRLKYKEIAEILNISVKTIDSQLAIALGKIAKAVNVTLKARFD
ncbi:RNA polymerase sigma-70 factor [Chitinophaga solisilvae]|uniref:RNA polymerase sigma-70 factor n=1 Tax=Chitinophaga solisilvae TaxID=1233460 RepID=UPI003B835C02